MNSVISALCAEGIAARENVPMREYTTLRVGGPAAVFVKPTTAEALARALQIAKENALRTLIVGNGSNLLIRDVGFDGMVVHIGEKMGGAVCEGNLLRVGAGTTLTAAALTAQRAGLSGMEPLSGIPGTCGGAVYMNAGAYGADVAALLKSATLLSPDGKTAEVPAEELGLGYRHSRMMETGEIVLGAVFSLTPGDSAQIAADMRSYAAKRREKQPVTFPSAGSFFKRPQGHFAGALIENAGLKGVRVGGAAVSELHAGFLVNLGGATAQDFLELAALVKTRVYETSGVEIEPEVRII